MPKHVFVLGPGQRCGTNFLHDLLVRHPQATTAGPPRGDSKVVFEDNLLVSASLLSAYVDRTRTIWNPQWKRDEALVADLCASIGTGVLTFIRRLAEVDTGDEATVTVSHAPFAENVELVERLFPDAVVLAIVRHPQAAVASGLESFGSIWGRRVRAWRLGVRSFLAAAAQPGAERWFRIVRYEDLITDLEPTLSGALEFAGLDPAAYDYGAADRMPVRGSSELVGQQGEVDWQGRPKDEQFQPLRRGEDWGALRVDRLRWLVGAEMEALGYGPTPELPTWRRPVDHAMDTAWSGLRLGRRVVDRVRH